MKSIKSLSSRIIHSRDCSDSFHALNILNIFLCVWNVCVWRVVCLGGGVSVGWCVWLCVFLWVAVCGFVYVVVFVCLGQLCVCVSVGGCVHVCGCVCLWFCV